MIDEKKIFFWAAFFCTVLILCFAVMLAHVERKLEQRIDDATAGSAYLVMRYECEDHWRADHPKEYLYEGDCRSENPVPSYVTDMGEFHETVERMREQGQL